MAKLAFSKLTLQKNFQVKEWSFNEQSIEVKQYLSIKERMDIAQLVIQQVIDFNNEFLNEFAFHMYMDLAIVFNYTNLSFTDKQKEDLYKLYDLLVGSGFMKELKKQVDCNQTDDLEVYTYETLNGYYKYHNSVYGIMDAMNQNYSNLNLDVNELQDKISNPESLSLVKDILTKMG